MTFSQIGDDGVLETYPDPFKDVGEEEVVLADKITSAILDAKNDIEVGFLKIAYLLDEAETHKLYKAQGWEKFKDWVASPDIELSQSMAKDLLRIRRQLLPVVGEVAVARAGVSKSRAVLPLLKDDPEGVKELLNDAPYMTYRDLVNEVKQRRGIEPPIEEGHPLVFTATKLLNENRTRIRIVGSDGNEILTLGTLTMPNDWFETWNRQVKGLQYDA